MRATLGFESQKTSEKNIIESRDDTRKINVTVDKPLNFEHKRDADTTSKKLLESIDFSLDNPSKAFTAVQTIFQRRLGDQVQGSGKWLRSDPRYMAWASPESLSFSVFGISGDEGHGKSFLFASIVKYPQEAQPQRENDMRCISTAYHIFDKDENRTSLVQALKVLAWQVANQDIVYRKGVSSVKATGINQIENLWDILFSKSYKSDSTIFLLLDGIDQIEKSELKEFVQVLEGLQAISETWSQFKLRIVITGRNETMNKLKSQLGEGILTIDMTSENNDDVEKFITDRMDKMEILGGSSDQVISLRRDILYNLKTQTQGYFVNIGLLLHEISGKQRPGIFYPALEVNDPDTIARKIELLNETLSEEDISDLNVLFTWVVFCPYPFDLGVLEGVLYLKAGESSLRPLAERINDKYSSLLRIKGKPHPRTKLIPTTSEVLLVSDSIEEFIRNKNGSDNAPDLDCTGDINAVEVRIVRRFLESVCDPNLFAKFGFEEFFQRKLKGKTALVGVDIDNAHLSMLSTCLEATHHQKSPELDSVLIYASRHFADHLTQADPSLTQPQHKMALGPQLVSLFTDEETIRKWWNPADPWQRLDWIYWDEFVEVSLKWLRDSAVTKNLPDDQRKWVKSLSYILAHVAKFTARLWLQSNVETEYIDSVFAALHGYITRIENRKNPQIERSTCDPTNETIHASHISDAAEWARQKLGLDSLRYEETRNLARTFGEYNLCDESIELFKLSCSLWEYNWLSKWGLATVYSYQKEYTLAIEMIEAAKNTIKCGETRDNDCQLVELDRTMAKYNKELGNSDEAFAIYEKILRHDPSDYDAALEMAMHFHKNKNSEGLLKFLDSLKASIEDSTGLDRRTQMFHRHFANDQYHRAILALVSDNKTFDAIFESYQIAIAASKEQLAKATNEGDEIFHRDCQALLMDYIAHLCYNNGGENASQREFAIEEWIRILQIDETSIETYVATTKVFVCTKLANVCFHEAMQDPSKAATYLDQLDQLATFKPTYVNSEQRSVTYPTELVARYHALQGDEKKAKDALRTHTKQNIDILSDDDPSNDWQGYQGLARYLMFAGQDTDCLAAWSLIVPFDDEETNST
ncbi:Tetratricopeptide-like helical [Penicillium psychrosexuale]|uniref:Tetratricopeptide-like helical n=1 Tax=Penicillium psychrosexuale TaxID=1002107 RepID=UPI0025459E1C|nr:Tetratricopeptide-like helical [Penicillium psychrosexuale]KAJ5789998.1 Tetratricopeptide-like helical [Penicillium psychrosexuale]